MEVEAAAIEAMQNSAQAEIVDSVSTVLKLNLQETQQTAAH